LTIATAEAYISSDGTSGWCSAESGKKYTTLTYYIGLYYEFSADNKVFDRGYILSLDPTVADILYKKNKPSGTHESVYSIARSYYSYDGTTWYLDASTGIGATIAGYCIIWLTLT